MGLGAPTARADAQTVTSPITVEFRYETGLSSSPFAGATLTGSWSADGRPSPDAWSSVPMQAMRCEDGSPGFEARIELSVDTPAQTFSWGVQLEYADGSSAWGIFAETPN